MEDFWAVSPRLSSPILSNAFRLRIQIKIGDNVTDFIYQFNRVTEEFLGVHRPARATMQVLALPKGAPCGMDVVAALN